MDNRLYDLYCIPENVLPQDLHILDLREHCVHLDERVRELMAGLPEEQRQLLESYMDTRDELEFQSVKMALRLGKKHG